MRNLTIENGKYGEYDICMNSDHKMENNEIIIPISIMKTGVFNGYLKTPEDLKTSTKWWEGLPIVIKNSNDISGHPETVIVTTKTHRVGQVRDVTWDAEKERLVANAHIDIELCPKWLLDDLEIGKIKGVSGTYFTDLVKIEGEKGGKKYTAIETNYAPNNIAIVNNPACTPLEGCGLNVNEKIENGNNQNGVDKMTDEVIDTKTMELEKKLVDMEIQMNSLKQTITEKETLIAGYEKAKKESEFLAQFPVENQKAARDELLPLFMEDPAKMLVTNSKRLGELLVPPVTNASHTHVITEESKGSEHVDLEFPEMNEEKEIEDMVPSAEAVLEMVRGRRV